MTFYIVVLRNPVTKQPSLLLQSCTAVTSPTSTVSYSHNIVFMGPEMAIKVNDWMVCLTTDQVASNNTVNCKAVESVSCSCINNDFISACPFFVGTAELELE